MTNKNWLAAVSCKVPHSNSAFFSFTLWRTALTLTRVQKIPVLLSLMLSQLCWSCKPSPIVISSDLVVMILNMKVSHLYVSPFLPEFILVHSRPFSPLCLFLWWSRCTISAWTTSMHVATSDSSASATSLQVWRMWWKYLLCCDFMWQCWNRLFLPIVSVVYSLIPRPASL